MTAPTRPRIGFSTNIWDNPAEIVEHLEFLAGHFTDIEFEIAEEAQEVLFGADGPEYERIVDGMRHVIDKHGLDVSVHAAWYGPHTDLVSPDERERAESISYLRRAVHLAADLNVQRVTYHPGYMSRRPNDVLLDVLRSSLDRVQPLLSRTGVQLCIENMGANRPRYVVFSPEEHVELCRSTGTWMTLDVPHLATVHLPRGDYDEALAMVAPYVRTAHIADIKGADHTHIPIGEGDFDLWGSLETLGTYGFDGAAVVEEFAKGYQPEQYLEAALDFRRRWDAEGARLRGEG
ncbi:sugar phosphate isomerase/epimerase family protein [Streptomyces sp. NPDC007205]|uniref:sugar phosphate isomerase/epimerase family protein n=1 Tax=Streptomyces sp. NPDC007205 TaxID=3154316 RepID=UPI0033F43949